MSMLPVNWAEAELGSLGLWVGGSTPSKSNPRFWEAGTIPWASPKDIKRDIIDHTEDLITQAAIDYGAASIVPAGSVLVVTRSGILQHSVPVAIAGVDLAINQDVKALILGPGIEPTFVAEQIRARQADILEAAAKVGATVESIDLGRLTKFRMRVPPTGEQKRIIIRLGGIRKAIARSRIEIDEATNLVSVTRSTITERELALQTKRLPVSTEAALQISDVISIPIRNGLSVRGNNEPPGVRALRLSALRTPIVDVNDVRYLTIAPEEATKYTLEAGDVLISRGSGTRSFVGLASLVPELDEITIFPDTSFRVRLDQERVVPEWFVATWNSPAQRARIMLAARTTAGIWKISQRDLAGFTFELPPLVDQLQVAESLRAANARLDRILEKCGRAHRLLTRAEQTIVTQAFDGRLVEQKDEDGSAIDLIRAINAAPKPVLSRKKRVAMSTKSTQDRLDDLLENWPEGGRSFEELRQSLPAPYDEIKTALFALLASGKIEQRFDASSGVVHLVTAL